VTVAEIYLASAILAFYWDSLLSRSAALEALKVCLWPLAVKWNLLAPSTAGSEASALVAGLAQELQKVEI
jgi:hypothetical protein